jgi:hypothetical protein
VRRHESKSSTSASREAESGAAWLASSYVPEEGDAGRAWAEEHRTARPTKNCIEDVCVDAGGRRGG